VLELFDELRDRDVRPFNREFGGIEKGGKDVQAAQSDIDPSSMTSSIGDIVGAWFGLPRGCLR
jgi:hypothetical protein